MSLAITKKNHTVLLLSQITKDFDWFYQLLIENDKITNDFVESLHDNEKNFMENMLPFLLQQAILEWKEKTQPPKDLGENKEKWVSCSLCGTPNRYIHYIINRQTKQEINVGSDCVKEYAFNDGDTENQRKEARKIRRIDLLNTEFPSIKRKVENWNDEIEKFEIWIPLSISKSYIGIGNELSKVYENFLDGRGSEGDSIKEIRELLSQGNKEIGKFKEYVDKNSNNNFVVTKPLYNWIKRNMGNQKVRIAFDKLKSNGVITYQTAHRLSEAGFMERIQTLINQHLKEKDIVMKGVESSEMIYIFEVGALKSCNMYISHQELLQNFGWILFNEKPFVELNVVEFIKSGSIKDERSMDILLKVISHNLKSEIVNLRGYDYDFDEIVLFDKRSEKCRVIPLKHFVSNYKVLSIKNDKNQMKQLSYEKGRDINLNNYQNSREGFTPL